MHWKLHYRSKLYRMTGRKPEEMEQWTSTVYSLRQAKRDTQRLAPGQLNGAKWRKIGTHTYRLAKKDAYFRIELEVLGWTPPRWEPKPSLNPEIRRKREQEA